MCIILTWCGNRKFGFEIFNNKEVAMEKRALGTLKWFDRKKGYGFIVPVDGGDDVYLNRGSFHREMTLGEVDLLTARDASEEARRVMYGVEQLRDGRVRAKDVASVSWLQ